MSGDLSKQTPHGDGRRRRMRLDKLTAVALVPSGANPHADVTFFKSKGADEPAEKRGGDLVDLVTGSEGGHQHGVNVSEHGEGLHLLVHFARGEDIEQHDHQVVMGPDGTFTMSENYGHTHELDQDRLRQVVFDRMTKRADQLDKQGPSRATRERLAEEGLALPDGSFPIRNGTDLRNAIQAFGRTAPDKRRQVALHIRRRARALDMTDRLPEEGTLADLLKRGTSEQPAGTTGNLEVGNKENVMTTTDKTKKAAGATEPTAEERIEKLEADLKVSNAIAALTDAEKIHYNALDKDLDDDRRAEFLAKTPDERKAILDEATAKAQDSDPVVHTAADGTEYRKSDDPRLVKMAKDRDEDRKDLLKSNAVNENTRLTKMAEDVLAHLPGNVETRVALIKSVESIPDEKQRTAAMDALKAQNSKLSPAFKTVGTGGAPEPDNMAKDNAEAKLDELAKAHAAEKGVDYYDAYDIVSKANPQLVATAIAG